MFGNLQGWIISAAMLLATAGMLYLLGNPSESSPENLIPLAYKPVELPVAASVVRPAGTKDCDAGELYRQAISEYQENPSIYLDAARTDLKKLPAVQSVLKAADCGRMHLFDRNLDKAINYDNKKPWIDAVMALGQATNDAGLRFRGDDKLDKARECYEAAFALGEKLFQERVTWDELNKGLSIMSMSAGALAKLADMNHDGARVDVLEQFREKTDNYHTTLQEKVASPLSNPVESYASKYAGDIFAVAKSPKADHVWRTEAILHLGHYRWNVDADRKGDQIWAPRELKLLEGVQDPKLHAAVVAAEGLTEEQQLKVGSPQ